MFVYKLFAALTGLYMSRSSSLEEIRKLEKIEMI